MPGYGEIYLAEQQWDNTIASYEAGEHISTLPSFPGFNTPTTGDINLWASTEDGSGTLNVSGNSTISIKPDGIDTTTYENIQVGIRIDYSTLNFDLSSAAQTAPMLDINLSDLIDYHTWDSPYIYIWLEETTFNLTGLENLAAGKYCLLNVTGANDLIDYGYNVGNGEGTKVSVEQTATGYAIYYEHGQVPEPTTASLGLLGLAALMMRRRRA